MSDQKHFKSEGSNSLKNDSKRSDVEHFWSDIFQKYLVLKTKVPFLLSRGQDVKYDQYLLRAQWALSPWEMN